MPLRQLFSEAEQDADEPKEPPRIARALLRLSASSEPGGLENEYCCENRHKRYATEEKQPIDSFEPG
jgi:hypothetical protein